MSVFTPKATKGGDFVKCPPGTHPAICMALIDLGTHKEVYKGKENSQRKICMVFEVVEQGDDSETRHFMTKEFNVAASEKSNLRKFAEAWRGKPYAEGEDIPLTKFIGVAGLANVIEKGSYTALATMTQLPKGMPRPAPSKVPFTWEIGQGKPPAHDWLPFLWGKPIKDKILASEEMKGGTSAATTTAKAEDGPAEEEIPF